MNARSNRHRDLEAAAVLLVAVGVLLLGTDCGSNQTSAYGGGPPGSAQNQAIAQQRYGGSHLGGTATGDTEAGAAFARWVLEQDPQRQYLTDAVVRQEQFLGVKVQPNITKRDLQQLLVGLAEGMARTFPGKPVTVDAFYQSCDKLAEARYDPRTQQVTFE